MAHSLTNLLYHLVFATKNRHPWLDDAMRPRVFEYLGGVIRGKGGTALIVGGMPDHVHIFARLRQDVAIANLLRAAKANSSGWIHRTFPDCPEFQWQAGYGAFTVSHSQSEKVRQYIENQEEHHRTVSFKDEYLALLKAHEVEFDDRLVLE